MTYAATTKVPIQQTKSDIEKLVTKHGADAFAIMVNREGAQIAFEIGQRRILFVLPLNPDAGAQAHRSRWRALLLVIKSKFESIDAGIETFEESFLAHVMTPDGQRFAEVALPAIDKAYEIGGPPQLLLNGPAS